jgi:hypothetical protein
MTTACEPGAIASEESARAVDDAVERRRAADCVADGLGERDLARKQIRNLVELLGLDFLAEALGLTADAFAEDSPLLLRQNGKHRRPGGVFFQIAYKLAREARYRETLSPEDWHRLFPTQCQKKRRRRERQAQGPTSPEDAEKKRQKNRRRRRQRDRAAERRGAERARAPAGQAKAAADQAERMKALESEACDITNLSGDPPIGSPAPAGTFWTGWIEIFDRNSLSRLRIYCAATTAGGIFWLDGLASNTGRGEPSGHWLAENDDEIAEAVRAVARKESAQ